MPKKGNRNKQRGQLKNETADRPSTAASLCEPIENPTGASGTSVSDENCSSFSTTVAQGTAKQNLSKTHQQPAESSALKPKTTNSQVITNNDQTDGINTSMCTLNIGQSNEAAINKTATIVLGSSKDQANNGVDSKSIQNTSNAQTNRSRNTGNPWGNKAQDVNATKNATPTPLERSSSAYPTLRAAVEQNVSPVDGSQKKARSNSNEPVRRRNFLRSVLPDTAELMPIRRPDQGGKAGKTVQLYTNHFPVTIDSCVINQYDVSVKLLCRDGKLREARKDERWEVVQQIIKREKFPLVWYDEGKTIYSRELLTEYTKPFTIEIVRNNEQKTFQFEIINLVRQENIANMKDFIGRKTAVRPKDSTRIVETLFKQRARNDLIAIRNQYYSRNQRLEDLGDGRAMANGFFQALFLTQMGITLNVNLAFTCFYLPLDFIEFANRYLRKDIRGGLNKHELDIFQRIVRNLSIETNHTGRDLRYRIRGFGAAAQDIVFFEGDSNDDDITLKKKTNVAEYFAKKYKKLHHPELPCIDGTSGMRDRANWIPMECAKMVPWQRALKPLDAVQRSQVTKKSVIKPEERYQRIMDIMAQREFQTDPYLKKLNVKVDFSEMMQVNARVLPPPEVKYRGRDGQDLVERVNFGKWVIRNRFYTTRDINNWTIAYFGSRPDDRINYVCQEFSAQLPRLLSRYGINLSRNFRTMMKPPTPQEIQQLMKDAVNSKTQIVFVILNDTGEETYDCVKKFGNQRFGVVTQCISFTALEKNIQKLDMYVQNLSQKVNAKLGCINGVVNLKTALSRPSHEDLFMFFGADVTHTTSSHERPSIAAVVGSRDPTNSLYAARLSEQYPKKGRFSIEIIKDLQSMVMDLLKVFSESCGNRLPTRVVFYRDGVDDGQYQKVLDNEVKRIKDAFRAIYKNRPLPRLTFIIVKKRHNTRFFLYENGQTKNVDSGTVVDQGITSPSEFDFYLCSQAALMGTSRPALYHVLQDENGFSSDEIQQLTYWLCHADARCSKAVSIPAPVHYAHLAAYKSRAFDFNGDEDSEEPDGARDEENLTIEDVQTKLVILDSKIADNMWFV